ncbi:50S ribosomal protein L7 [Oscillibacter hominis]|uniref:50S ribosomal protein L7 n=1 Tax=Oscillibacter hominis TaxID=2763056 RepID=A0A7G9B2P3_9FIRM|nr:50S ribosomal protein L7 [Oscillibacter hominis]QNL43824.1 50S ribosomal protein L7 [Oscillibacter hominis]
MENNNLLHLIGLAKKAGRLEAGEEPVGMVCRAQDARLILLASDAAASTARRALHFAQEGKCLSIRLPFSKDQLGRAVGRTSCAIAAMTDIGFASAVAGKLAASDPDAYGGTAEKLKLKAKRAAERHKAAEEKRAAGEQRAAAEKKVSAKRKVSAEKTAPPKSEGRKTSRGGAVQSPRSPAGQNARRRIAAKKNPYSGSRPVKRGKGSFRSKGSS